MVTKDESAPHEPKFDIYKQLPDLALAIDRGRSPSHGVINKESVLFQLQEELGALENHKNNRYYSGITGNDSSQAIADNDSETGMSTQDRYIDARLVGIEDKLDARLDAMQRFQEQAEARFQRATERHETDVALSKQQIQQEFSDARKHATNLAWTTVAGVFAVVAILAGIFAYWISDQGNYAKSYSDTRIELNRAAAERAEFRESVKAIQAQQQAILDRLPVNDPPAQ